MAPFLASLARDDLAPATLRGYRYDLRHFLAWHSAVQDSPFIIVDGCLNRRIVGVEGRSDVIAPAVSESGGSQEQCRERMGS